MSIVYLAIYIYMDYIGIRVKPLAVCIYTYVCVRMYLYVSIHTWQHSTAREMAQMKPSVLSVA